MKAFAMPSKIKIVTLATTFNRKDSTLRCLASLMHSCHCAGVEAIHYIVDDNSNDGTPESICQYFPKVKVLPGDGHLYWAGGMRHGFGFLKDIHIYDFLLAYNDDCVFNSDCVQTLLQGFELSCAMVGIVVGSLVDPDTGNISYGGRKLRFTTKWLPPSFTLAKPLGAVYSEVDSLNMNICSISSRLLDDLGFLDEHYRHSGADFDFGLRAKSKGYNILLAPGCVGFCRENSSSGTSREKFLSPIDRIQRVFSIKEYPLGQTFFYFRSHAGFLWPFWLVLFYVSRLCIL